MTSPDVYTCVDEVPEEVDSVIILGKQLGISSNMDDIRESSDHLSVASRLNIIGGAMLWTPDRTLIVSGNERAYFPQAATEYLEENFPHIPISSAVRIDANSPDTVASAINVKSMLQESELEIPVIASVAKHGIRAAAMFAQHGTRVRGIAQTEKIAATRSKKDEEVVIRWEHSLPTILEVAKEAILRTLDKDGKKMKPFTQIFRP